MAYSRMRLMATAIRVVTVDDGWGVSFDGVCIGRFKTQIEAEREAAKFMIPPRSMGEARWRRRAVGRSW